MGHYESEASLDYIVRASGQPGLHSKILLSQQTNKLPISFFLLDSFFLSSCSFVYNLRQSSDFFPF